MSIHVIMYNVIFPIIVQSINTINPVLLQASLEAAMSQQNTTIPNYGVEHTHSMHASATPR